MQKESNWRYYFILLVTALCLVFILPTGRYIGFVMNEPAPKPAADESAEDYQQRLREHKQTKAAMQRESIGLGLDLVGGVDVLLRIDRDKTRANQLEAKKLDISRSLREKAINARIALTGDERALLLELGDKADARQVANVLESYVDNRLLAPYDRQNFQETGSVRLELAARNLDNYIRDALDGAVKNIRKRVDAFGVVQPSVSTQYESESIRVQVPGAEDPERVIREIIRPAQLEFYLLHEENERLVAENFTLTTELNDRGEEVEVWQLREDAALPLGYKSMPGEEVDKQASTGSTLVTRPVVYVVKERPEMTGKNLTDAQMYINSMALDNPVRVSLAFNRQGAIEFGRVTRDNVGRRLAIALDGKIYSAPNIQTPILDGQAEITGNFSQTEARDLALVLKAGALPADLKVAEKRAVGPTLGADSISDSLRALAIGAIGITIFMVIYYGTAGIISILALILNVLVILACLDMFNATLTLSGIGGMILTLGMAVDANVLIYERIREEMRAGVDVRNAIRSGFGAAFSVIFDSNLTTLLTALVLLQFGEGSVQGFALTMAFGLLANLFTGLTVTYALCRLWFTLRGGLSLGFLTMFKNPRINFIGLRKVSLTLSSIVLIGAIGLLIANGGPHFAVDFKGGVLSDVRLTGDADRTQDISLALDEAGMGGGQAKVQRVRAGSGNDYLVRLALQEPPEGADVASTSYTQDRLENALTERFSGEGIEILGTTAVSSEVGQGFQTIALQVILLASICILAYLWFRFELVFGVAAVIALVHDLLITLAIVTALGVQVSLDIVSALLILLGLSVNDTIVIFDRVRENSHTMFGASFREICNAAMNRCLSRTVITSLTTVGIMAVMYLFGGHSLAPFALTLIVGGIIGTYSSSFVATPIVFIWNARQKGKLVEHLGRKGAAAGTGSASPVSGEVDPLAPAQPAAATAGQTPPPASGGGSPAPPRRRGRR